MLIQAQKTEENRYNVKGTAYNGGKLQVWAWSPPVIIDLKGLKIINKEVPLLYDHYNSPNSRLGLVRATKDEKTVTFEGEIVSESEESKNIILQLEKNAAWQVSIGARSLESEDVLEGSREINGVLHKAPFVHVKKSELNEISVVAIGADQKTKLIRARLDTTEDIHLFQTRKEEKNMVETGEKVQEVKARIPEPEPVDIEKIKQEILAKERSRCQEIRAICAGEFPDVESEAIEKNYTPDQVRVTVLAKIRENRQKPEVGVFNVHTPTRPEGEELKSIITAALLMKGGQLGDELLRAKQFNENILCKADNYRLPLGEICTIIARAEGKTDAQYFLSGRKDEIIRAAFSTHALAGILNNVANKELLRSYNSIPSYVDLIAKPGDLNDFKEHERYRMNDRGDLEEIPPTGAFPHGTVSEEKATIKLKTYGKIFGLSREDIVNDDLGAFLKIPRKFGRKGVIKKDKLFFTKLLANGTFQGAALFAAARGNYDSGANTAVSFTALQQMIQMFNDQTDADGDPIAIGPRFWMVPTKWEMRAKEISGSKNKMAAGGDATDDTASVEYPTMNALSMAGLTVLAPPYLSNTQFTGYSTEGHYLFASPNDADTFEMGYFDGKRTPTVEFFQTDPTTLGILYRIYFDLACEPMDYRGMVFFKGTA